jgi:hypothetical protein
MDLSKLNKQAVKTTTPSAKLGVQTGSMKIKTGIKAGWDVYSPNLPSPGTDRSLAGVRATRAAMP